MRSISHEVAPVNQVHPVNGVRSFGERFWSIAGGVSVRTKILGILLGLVIVLGLGVTIDMRASLERVMIAELETRTISIAQDLAVRSTDLILINDLYSLYQLLRDTQFNHPDVRYTFVLDSRGNVLVHTFGPGFPMALIEANTLQLDHDYSTVVLQTTEGKIWDVAVPILGGLEGTARVGISDASLRRSLSQMTTRLMLTTLLVSTVGIAAAIFLTWMITHPLLKLAQAARAVGSGDLTQRVTLWADDEIGDLTEAFNAMVTDLSQAAEDSRNRERLRAQLVERVITVQEEERKRIARDLHDHTSQSLVSLIVQLKLVESAKDEESRSKGILEFRHQLQSVLGEVRQLALDLRPGVLDDLGLVAAIQWFADRCQNESTAISVEVDGDCKYLPPHVALAIYRVAQEALSNTFMHSGATQVVVFLRCRPNSLFLEVRDNGKGFDPTMITYSNSGMGLFGMEERLQLLNGRLTIESQPGEGTCIQAKVPLEFFEESL
jgi:signal transduction histidine kinase